MLEHSILLLFVYLADAFSQGDCQRLGCVNYASAGESLTTMSHPKDGAQGGSVTCSGSDNESVAEMGFELGTSWLQALFFNHWTTQPAYESLKLKALKLKMTVMFLYIMHFKNTFFYKSIGFN